jgi:catechol 2,3-dioxygenase-like lactoylglutathione lyase family enzyme
MIQVIRMGHVTFEIVDLERLVSYYVDALGLSIIHRDAGMAYLACPADAYSIVLQSGPVARCSKLSLQLAPDADFDEAGRYLKSEGLLPERRSDSAPLIAHSISFKDPAGLHVELYQALPGCGLWAEPTTGVKPDRLGHTAFFVPGVQGVVDFHVRALGFRVSDWNGDFFAFLRCNPDHHTVNLHEGTETRGHHIAFEVRDWNRLRDSSDCLARHGVQILWGPLRLGAGHNLATYHRDPDGNLIELFTELDRMSNEALGYFDPRPWHEDNPQRPKVRLNNEGDTRRWGLPRPANQRY